MIIGITGKARAGKNTAALFFEDIGYAHYSFANPIRTVVADIIGVDLQTLETIKEVPMDVLGGKTPRYAMQTLGTEWGRELIYQNIWVDSCLNKAERAKNAVISDVRFDNEARAIVDRGGVVIQIERQDAQIITNATHASEQGIQLSLITHKFMNNGSIPDLFDQLKMWYYGSFAVQR